MPLPTDEQKQQYYAQRYGDYAPYRPELSNFTTAYRSPEPQYGFMEQVYKNFQTENIVGAALYYMNDPKLGEMPFVPQAGFNPGEYIGRYEPYIEQYPELAESRSMAEFNYIASRIDRDLLDREIVQQGGFWRGLATGAPAGILDPINLLPFGTAAKGISIAGKALARKQLADALSRGVVSRAILKRGIRPGIEGAIAQYPVELVLSSYQPMRTEDERYQNIMGAAVFSSVLGVSGGVIGAAKRKAMISLVGAESTNTAMQESGMRLFGPGGVFGPPAAQEAQTGVQRVRSKNSKFAAYIDAEHEVQRRRENYLASVRAQERAGERLPLYQRGLQEIVQPDERRSPISAMRSAADAISRVASRRAVRAADLTERLRKSFSLTRAAPSDRPGLARDFYDQVEGRTQLRRDEGRVSGGVDRAYNIDTGVAERLMELADDPDAGLSLRVREDGFVEATWFENGVGKAETIPYEIDYVDRQDPMTTRWPENSVDLVDMAKSMSQRTLDHVGPRPMETPAQYFGRIYRGGYGSGAVRLSKEDAAYLREVEANPEQVAGEGMELIVRVEGDKIVVYKREKTEAAQAKPRGKKARGKRAKEQQRAEKAVAAAIGEPTKAPIEVVVRTIQMKEPVNTSVDFMERALAEDGRPQAEVTDAPFAAELEADSKGVMLDPDAYVVRISRDKGKPSIWSTQEIAESGAVPVEDALRDPKVRNAVEEIEHLDNWRSAPESVAKAEEAKAKISSAREDARPARAKIKSEREVVKQATDKAEAADKAYREELKYAEVEFGKEAQELAESYAMSGGAWPKPTPLNETRKKELDDFDKEPSLSTEPEFVLSAEDREKLKSLIEKRDRAKKKKESVEKKQEEWSKKFEKKIKKAQERDLKNYEKAAERAWETSEKYIGSVKASRENYKDYPEVIGDEKDHEFTRSSMIRKKKEYIENWKKLYPYDDNISKEIMPKGPNGRPIVVEGPKLASWRTGKIPEFPEVPDEVLKDFAYTNAEIELMGGEDMLNKRSTPKTKMPNVRFRMFVEQEAAIRESEAQRRAKGWLTPAEEQAIVLHDLREKARLSKEELEIAKNELAETKGEFASVLQEAADVREVNRGDIAQQQQFDFVDVSAKSGFVSRRKEGMDLHTNLRMLAKDLYTGMRSVGAAWERSYRVTAGGAIVNKATIYNTRGTARGHGGKKYGHKYRQIVDHFNSRSSDPSGRKLSDKALAAPYKVYRIAGQVDPNIDAIVHQPRGTDRWYVVTDADVNPARATEHANRMGYDRPFTVGQSTGGWRSLDSQPSFQSKKAAEAFVRQRYREWVQTTGREAWEDNRRSVYQKSIDKVQLEVEHTRDAFARRQELQNIVEVAKGKYIRRDTEELLAPEVKAMQPAPGYRAIVSRVGPTIKDLRCP